MQYLLVPVIHSQVSCQCSHAIYIYKPVLQHKLFIYWAFIDFVSKCAKYKWSCKNNPQAHTHTQTQTPQQTSHNKHCMTKPKHRQKYRFKLQFNGIKNTAKIKNAKWVFCEQLKSKLHLITNPSSLAVGLKCLRV